MAAEQTDELETLEHAQLLTVRVFRDVTGLGDPTPVISADHFAQAVAIAFEFGRAVSANRRLGRRTCRVCGCWEFGACPGGCGWAEQDLCTACTPQSGEPHVAS